MKKLKKWLQTSCVMFVMGALLAGCSGGKEDQVKEENKKEVAMGRYVEKEIQMPKLGKQAAKNGVPFQTIVKNPDGKLEFFYVADGKVKQYVLEESEKWKEMKAVFELSDPKQYVLDLKYGLDGKLYVLGRNSNETAWILRITDGKEEAIPSKEIEKTRLSSFSVNMSGKIILSGVGTGSSDNAIVLNADGSKAWEAEESSNSPVTAQNENFLIVDSEYKNIQVCQEKDGTVIKSYPLKMDYKISLASDSDGGLYVIDGDGLQHIAKDGSKWEMLADGALLSVSRPSLSLDTMIIGDDDDFYFGFKNGEGNYQTMHCFYDKTVASKPDKTLTIYSLDDFDGIRQAASIFQIENPDVKVDYRVVSDENGAATREDAIKALNTELLAGEGADIIVCDSLPFRSYIEKGVLADLSDLTKELVEGQSLYQGLIKPFTVDGKVYAVPNRIGLNLYIGNEKALKSADSLKTMVQYCKQNSDIPMMGDIPYKELYFDIFSVFGTQCFHEDGTLDEAKMAEFLDQLKVIGKQTKAHASKEDNSDWLNPFVSTIGVADKKLALLKNQTSDIWDAALISAAKKRGDIDYQLANKSFDTRGIVSVNAGSKQQKLAKEFIRTLLGEQVQKAELEDGFPVNPSAVESLKLKHSIYSMGVSLPDSDEMIGLSWPSKAERAKMLDLIGEAENCSDVFWDENMSSLIWEEAEVFFEEKQTTEETVQAIVKKLKLSGK